MSKKIHRYINIDILPKNGKLISFKDSVGMSVYFEYKNIKDIDIDLSNYEEIILGFPT